MNTNEVIQIFDTLIKLKDRTRHCYTEQGRHESVAEHSWMLAIMAFILREEFPELDMQKVLDMVLIHDIGEIFTGDIPTFQKTKEDEEREEACLIQWLNQLPSPLKTRMSSLFEEMEDRETKEAKLYKALDQIEAVFQHNRSDISTWLDLEYDLQLSYGQETCNPFPFMKELRQAVKEESLDKINKEGKKK